MGNAVSCCGKTIGKTNEEATKRQRKHRKFKKCNTLKYKPQNPQKPITILKADQYLPQQPYPNAVSAGMIQKSSFTDITNQFSTTTWKNNETRKNPSIERVSSQGISLENNIQLLNPTTSKKQWRKPQTRNNSKTNHNEEKRTSKTEKLKNKIRILKQNKQYNSDSNYQSTSSTSHQNTYNRPPFQTTNNNRPQQTKN